MRTTIVSWIVASVMVGFSGFASSHGWTEFPKARQIFCAEDGGYWHPSDGSAIPNSACRAAFLESGTYPFVQKNEFSANVANYNEDSAVQSVVIDGYLCSAGSSAKAGMDIPSPDWQKTLLAAGSHRLKFRATAAHNPSYWRIYLTKPGFDSATQRLQWSDLEIINSYGNLPVVNGYYEMDINIPTERSGTGVLYVRWQRNDPAGEGFYNCSDIIFE
ncbi:lytic polysaccharide monooxygenase auxiliary activity family 9 protein [Microbulbifer spongiae]|uniref:Lytic polysaccharide monooxygenase n=1 Tax=Microbulbifer spongiae TaxID=2944933 RepID=A0ABY9EDB8_9GAMM|nr:lytic polysaccharide monooxygenase auxiliary activity family 9 protein [Microbulbifer sp. MI-G]WKD50994.1 lytic polysaccharide monooxygenase [Microbulbifer sp. MI-G]